MVVCSLDPILKKKLHLKRERKGNYRLTSYFTVNPDALPIDPILLYAGSSLLKLDLRELRPSEAKLAAAWDEELMEPLQAASGSIMAEF